MHLFIFLFVYLIIYQFTYLFSSFHITNIKPILIDACILYFYFEIYAKYTDIYFSVYFLKRSINPFAPNAPFLYPPKTKKNRKGF